MFECQNCGYRFPEPVRRAERREFWGRPVTEEIDGCPICGGGYIEINDGSRATWNDLFMILLDKGHDSEVAGCVCELLMADCGSWDWDEEAPEAAQTVIECVPIKEDDI